MHSSLELLLLMLVRDGITSPYQLKSHSGLSLGSTVPALNRLKAAGLLKVSARGARGLREFAITSKGMRVLRTEWRKQLKLSTLDTDSILRVAFLGWKHGSEQDAADFLEASAERIRGMSAVAAAEVDRFRQLLGKREIEQLRWLRARVASARLDAEAAELLRLATQIREGANIKQKIRVKGRRVKQ